MNEYLVKYNRGDNKSREAKIILASNAVDALGKIDQLGGFFRLIDIHKI